MERTMKKWFLILFLATPCFAEGPLYRQKDPSAQLEIENIYQDIRKSNSKYIWNSTSPQPNSAFNVSSGTAGSILLTGTIGGSAFRTDSSLEISRGYTAGNGALLSIFDATLPGALYSESAIAFGAYDSAGNKRKTASISTKWSSTDTTTGYAVLRLNPTSDGGLTNPTDIQIYGDHGIRIFETATSTPIGYHVLSTSGTVIQPIQPSFIVTNSAGAADVTGDGTVYTVVWGNEIRDAASNFASNTFTAPITGQYGLQAAVLLRQITTSYTSFIISIVTSNREYRQTYIGTTNFNSLPLSVSCYADMDAGDTATVTITVSGSTKVIDVDNDAKQNYFTGTLIN